MEFQAYPTAPKGRKSLVWQIQNILHSDSSVILPGALLLAATGVVVYEHITSPSTATRNIMFMIMITMLPLAFLEKKIFSCPDPVDALCKFSTKVLLMHLFFLVGHVLHAVVSARHIGSVAYSNADLWFLVAACILLPTVFDLCFSRKFMYDHLDVWCTVLLSCLAAASTEALTTYWNPNNEFLLSTLETSNMYIELMAFVPAIWTVCRAHKDAPGAKSVDMEDAKKRAVCFLAFLFAFYAVEDIYYGVYMNWDMRLGTLGHTAHFLLFLDFAAFLLAHFYDTDKFEKLITPLMNLFAEPAYVV